MKEQHIDSCGGWEWAAIPAQEENNKDKQNNNESVKENQST